MSPLNLVLEFGSTTATLSIGCIENGAETSDAVTFYCRNAISYLKDGNLFEWYELKKSEIKNLAGAMLSHQDLDMVNQIPRQTDQLGKYQVA